MLDKGQLFARLRSGETMDQILEELTQDLNTVEKEYQESEAKRIEEEKRAAAEKEEENRVYNAKRAAVDDMLDAMCDYLVAAGEEELLDEIKEIDTDKVIELLDGAIEFSKSMEKLKTLEFPVVDRNWHWIDSILS